MGTMSRWSLSFDWFLWLDETNHINETNSSQSVTHNRRGSQRWETGRDRLTVTMSANLMHPDRARTRRLESRMSPFSRLRRSGRLNQKTTGASVYSRSFGSNVDGRLSQEFRTRQTGS